MSRVPVIAATYREWRVVATFREEFGEPSAFDFTWSPRVNPNLGDSELKAREFYDWASRRPYWTDLRLLVRNVVVGDWHEEDDDLGQLRALQAAVATASPRQDGSLSE